MRLEFTELHIENFKSFRKAKLELKGYGTGLHFLRGRNDVEPSLGSNGAGKSSLWDSLSWVCYGRTPDGLRNTDITPWGKTARSLVQVSIQIDKRTHTLERTANPNSLTLDGKTVDQTHIDRLLRLNYETFCHTVLLGQAQPLFFDLAPRNKLELFSTVLDLDRWDSRSEQASKRTRDLELRKTELTTTVQTTNAELGRVMDNLKVVSQQFDNWAKDRAANLELLCKERDEVAKRLAILDKQWATANLNYDNAETEARAYTRDLLKLRNELTAATGTLRRYQGRQDAFRSEMIELKKSTKEGKCPTCGQSLKGTHGHYNRMKELQSLIEDAVPAPIAATVNTLAEKLQTSESYEKIFREKAQVARDNLDALTPQLEEIKAKDAMLKLRAKDLEQEFNPHARQKRLLEGQVTTLSEKASEAEQELKRIDRRIERTRYWVKGFKDVRLYIIEEILQELELTTNAMLEDVGLIGWQVRYAIEKETKSGTIQRGLNTMILSPSNDRLVRFENWSGGEGQRLRLVGALALGEVLLNHAGVTPTLEILDEPSAHLSQEGVRDLVDFLAARATALDKSIWLTDHVAIPSARFASTLTVVKTDKGSMLEGGNGGENTVVRAKDHRHHRERVRAS